MIRQEIDNSDEISDNPINVITNVVDNEQMESDIEKYKDLAKENERKYLYLAAEFDNYRKRTEKNMYDYKIYKNKDIILDLLDIVDDFERALTIDIDNQGLNIIYNKFKKLLCNDGLEEINIEIGQPFDDNIMNCVYTTGTSVESLHNTVASITRKGYKYKDMVLRYTDVVTYNKN